ncbi:17294_t:CDS:2, partial [Gigaspora margarita]
MWMILKQKIFEELSVCVTKIKHEIANDFSARRTKIANKLNTKNNATIIVEIKRILTNVYRKLTAEINTKITNELFEINTELNNKLITEITKINTHDAGTPLSSSFGNFICYPIHLLKKIGTILSIFDLKKEIGDTMDYIFETVKHEIRQLTGGWLGK